ncbi:hypothetical protein Rsub_08910 [Raphidocelis subcapitata]|uniref:Uncharacterized protein n=1 Tax=Raphidocelis subcapitata TaxID=307507 RepID=A0A2V0PB47_9CHLO|nr:hypothetical protein Rsub_08910 [Raphidocelis subcapitata]|eukprot:GBF96162.1 hypothetical protein Rsub_08910 [Raphidocelis subcapitata]
MRVTGPHPAGRAWAGQAGRVTTFHPRRRLRCVAQEQQQQASMPRPPPPPSPSPGAAAAPQRGAPPPGADAFAWVPISGPPGEAPPEMRRMQHPADAPATALAPPPAAGAGAGVAQARLVIGGREAREQAVALATASAEVMRWKSVVVAAQAAKNLLEFRARELEEQRDQSMEVTRELLAGCQDLQRQLAEAKARLEAYEGRADGLKDHLLDLKGAAQGGGGGGGGGGAAGGGVPWPLSVLAAAGLSGNGGGWGGGAGGGDKAPPSVEELLGTAQRLASEAARGDEARQRAGSALVASSAGGGGESGGGGGAAGGAAADGARAFGGAADSGAADSFSSVDTAASTRDED